MIRRMIENLRMKKTVMIGLNVAACLLFGCSSKQEISKENTSLTNANTWHVLPDIDASRIKELTPFSYDELHQNGSNALLISNQTGYLNTSMHTGYTDNAVIMEKDGVQSIYDYDGNLIYTVNENVSNTYHEEGIMAGYARTSSENNYFSTVYGMRIPKKKAVVFHGDFASISEMNENDFIAYPYDGNQQFGDIAIKNKELGIVSHIKNKNGEDTDGYKFEKYDRKIHSDLFLANIVNSANVIEQKVIMNRQGKVLCKVDYEVLHRESGIFVNGYLAVYQKDASDKIGLFDANHGKLITELKYQDVGYFSDGYCPVMNADGKWAYINEKGEEVTDFMFVDASNLYEGKAFIIKDQKAGILNLKDAVSKKKLDVSIFQETVSDAPVARKETSDTQESKDMIGTVTINIDSLNIRTDAGTSQPANGTATKNETYEVFEKKDADGYTWYRIGEKQWIAGNSEWVTYKE